MSIEPILERIFDKFYREYALIKNLMMFSRELALLMIMQ